MPSVDPMQYLLEAMSTLTGGLITDLQTLFLGLLVCSFILMALDLLKESILEPFLSNPRGYLAEKRINRRVEGFVNAGPARRLSSSEIEISSDRSRDLEDAVDGSLYFGSSNKRL